MPLIRQPYPAAQAPIAAYTGSAVNQTPVFHQRHSRRNLHLPLLRQHTALIIHIIEMQLLALHISAHLLRRARAQRHAQHRHTGLVQPVDHGRSIATNAAPATQKYTTTVWPSESSASEVCRPDKVCTGASAMPAGCTGRRYQSTAKASKATITKVWATCLIQ